MQRQLLERETKEIKGFPGLMEKVKIEPVSDDKPKKGKAKVAAEPVETAPAGKKNTKKKLSVKSMKNN
jgi:hypothetical protein